MNCDRCPFFTEVSKFGGARVGGSCEWNAVIAQLAINPFEQITVVTTISRQRLSETDTRELHSSAGVLVMLAFAWRA